MDGPGLFADIAFPHDGADHEHLPGFSVNDKGLRLTRLMDKSHVDIILLSSYCCA